MNNSDQQGLEKKPGMSAEAVMRAVFSSGKGVINITPTMSDADILKLIKTGLACSHGQPFTVVGVERP